VFGRCSKKGRKNYQKEKKIHSINEVETLTMVFTNFFLLNTFSKTRFRTNKVNSKQMVLYMDEIDSFKNQKAISQIKNNYMNYKNQLKFYENQTLLVKLL